MVCDQEEVPFISYKLEHMCYVWESKVFSTLTKQTQDKQMHRKNKTYSYGETTLRRQVEKEVCRWWRQKDMTCR